ncbi:hypothetical protein KGF54_004886 [Candida jiufengensis]|uniref:uncharacterized protein n=1 Tax=Candida jiufengensis TaxID=497108 RepID=UPI0022245267|nr:uncharacterized protein KGF54_004886 [Candida jiufengensis]KAI5951811.1 hypothetical protein KGF54_004886 [Candida jiufengensis]
MTITSLPFPPPPPIKRSSTLSNSSSFNRIRPVTSSSALSQRQTNCNETTTISDEENFEEMEQEEVDDDEFFEYSYEEEDPIVLVEDYLSTNLNQESSYTINSSSHKILRQKSLADFKKRIMSSCSTTSSVNSSIDTIQQDTQTYTTNQSSISSDQPQNPALPPQQQQQQLVDDLQAIYGDLPSFKLLKYCDLCSKPLYEISSIINSTINSTINPSNLNEFICGDCIGNYEIFLNEFYNSQENNLQKELIENEEFKEDIRDKKNHNSNNGKNQNKIKNMKLWNILNQISCKYNIKREVL